MNDRRASDLPRFSLQLVLLTLLAIINLTLGIWLERTQEEGGYPIHLVAVLWVLTLIFCLWLGNLLIYRFMSRAYSWEVSFNRRFFLQMLLTLFYSLACINASYLLFKSRYTELPPDENQLILLNIYGTLFLVPVLSLQFGLLFLQKWKRAVVEQEKLKKEQVQSELMALKAHLSPHFLFNNLNILSSLIDEGNHEAQEFLGSFAEVYRYVLKNQEVELVALREELQFLESYVFLLKRRFSGGLEIGIQTSGELQDHLIPPLVLQMVLENALKHNKLSEHHPLQIAIYTTGAPAIVIRNNLQVRAIPEREKTGLGLENISRRYWLIARTDIEVTQTEDTFTVKLPLITNK